MNNEPKYNLFNKKIDVANYNIITCAPTSSVLIGFFFFFFFGRLRVFIPLSRKDSLVHPDHFAQFHIYYKNKNTTF